LIGDTDSSDYAITNDNISFALTQAGDDVYVAGAICCRALAAKYATLVDTDFESVSSDYSQLQTNYYALATKLEAQSKKYGTRGLGLPAAGGLTYSGIRANDLNDDRVQPKFKQDQFANPPVGYDPERYGY
jgi:hypothetical protein